MDQAWSVASLKSDRTILVAATSSCGSGSADAWVISLNSDGKVIWDQIFGGDKWDRPTALTISSEGAILVSGYTTTKGAAFEDY